MTAYNLQMTRDAHADARVCSTTATAAAAKIAQIADQLGATGFAAQPLAQRQAVIAQLDAELDQLEAAAARLRAVHASLVTDYGTT